MVTALESDIAAFVRDVLEGPPDAFKGFVPQDLLALRPPAASWKFGNDLAQHALTAYRPGQPPSERIEIFVLRQASMNAAWYAVPGGERSFAIGVNAGLVEALRLVAEDLFTDGGAGEIFTIDDETARRAAPVVRSRVGAVLELGYPISSSAPIPISPRRRQQIDSMIADALRFVVFHEIAHVLLGHLGARRGFFTNRFTSTQIASFSMAQEHQADALALRILGSTRSSDAKITAGFEYAGALLFLMTLGFFERHRNFATAFEVPHAHPPAYERLFRLRMAIAQGGGYVYWPVFDEAGMRLARADLKPSPSGVEYLDAIANCMLRVQQEIEAATDPLYSPLNSLANDCTGTSGSPDHERFSDTMLRWMFLGSPDRILQLCGESRRNALTGAGPLPPTNPDRAFLLDSAALIDGFVEKARMIPSSEVRRAVETFDRVVNDAG